MGWPVALARVSAYGRPTGSPKQTVGGLNTGTTCRAGRIPLGRPDARANRRRVEHRDDIGGRADAAWGRPDGSPLPDIPIADGAAGAFVVPFPPHRIHHNVSSGVRDRRRRPQHPVVVTALPQPPPSGPDPPGNPRLGHPGLQLTDQRAHASSRRAASRRRQPPAPLSQQPENSMQVVRHHDQGIHHHPIATAR